MNLLITGGAGFIGSEFIRQHLAEPVSVGGSVVNLDKLTYAGNPENLLTCEHHPSYHFVRGDIEDSALIGALLKEHAIDAIVHFAAETHVDRSIDSPEPFFRTNLNGTLRLLESARRYRAGLSPALAEQFRFLHVSTDEVYGALEPRDAPFTENSPILPNSPYAAAKAAADHLVRSYFVTYGFPALIVRCSNNYGPFQFPEKLIPLMILNALEEKPLPVYGDGLQVRDWIFVEDHCRALAIVLTKGAPGEVYNVGGCCEKTNLDTVEALCRSLDKERPRKGGASYCDLITFVEDRPGHDRRYAIDCHKLETHLGWTPRQSFEDGIRSTVSWYLGNKEWCDHIDSNIYQRERLGTGNR